MAIIKKLKPHEYSEARKEAIQEMEEVKANINQVTQRQMRLKHYIK